METTDFEKIASSLTFRSICSPLGPDITLGPDIKEDDEIDIAISIILQGSRGDPNDSPPSRVIRSNRTLGIVWYIDLLNAGVITEAITAEPPLAGEFLSADTNILEAIHLFSSGSQYYYILEKNDVVGILYYSDIFKPLGRLAFLALALEIEQLALELCTMFHLSDQCWEALSKNRQPMARAVYKKRHGHPPKKIKGKYTALKELIECTYLSDKANMIWKNRLIRASSRKSVLGFFHRLEEIRDLCTHPRLKFDLAEELPPESLGTFVDEAMVMKKNLVEAVEENRVKEGAAIQSIMRELGLL